MKNTGTVFCIEVPHALNYCAARRHQASFSRHYQRPSIEHAANKTGDGRAGEKPAQALTLPVVKHADIKIRMAKTSKANFCICVFYHQEYVIDTLLYGLQPAQCSRTRAHPSLAVQTAPTRTRPVRRSAAPPAATDHTPVPV